MKTNSNSSSLETSLNQQCMSYHSCQNSCHIISRSQNGETIIPTTQKHRGYCFSRSLLEPSSEQYSPSRSLCCILGPLYFQIKRFYNHDNFVQVSCPLPQLEYCCLQSKTEYIKLIEGVQRSFTSNSLRSIGVKRINFWQWPMA